MAIPSLSKMLDLGLHFGHLKSYSHPGSKLFVFTIKDGVCIINLEKTQEKLKEALEYLKKIAQEDKVILFVGTKRQASPLIKEGAEKLKMPYVDKRFLGGTLTNFEGVLKNINKLESLKEKEKELEEKGTKKEKVRIAKEIEKVSNLLGGLVTLKKLPDALFIVDVVKQKNAVLEANRLKIPIVAIVDTNGDPSLVDYPIPANDDSKKGLEFIINQIAEAYLEGKTPRKTRGKVKKKAK